MNVIVVSHPDRLDYVEQLQHSSLSIVTTVIDTVSALNGHRTALRLALAHTSRVVIMEDDAIPVENFHALAQEWCDLHPDDLLSFYLGTSYPRNHQPMVDERMRIADMQGRRELQMPQLIHGVCYSIPVNRLQEVVNRLDAMTGNQAADFAIGAAWQRAVYYPLESLVQHRDTAPVEKHPDGLVRQMPRVARRLAGPLMFNPTQE